MWVKELQQQANLNIVIMLASDKIDLMQPSQLHALCHLASCGCTHHVAMLLTLAYSLCMLSFFFFLVTSSFAVQSSCANGTRVMWPQECDDDDCSYSTMQCNNNHHDCNTTWCNNHDCDTTCGITAATMTIHSAMTATTTTMPHGMMIVPMTPLVVVTQAHLSLFMVMVVVASRAPLRWALSSRLCL